MTRRLSLTGLLVVLSLASSSADERKKSAGNPKPAEPSATPVTKIKTLKDFKVELVHSCRRDTEGSWVNMCVDSRGRLIVSDQYGGLFRVTPPALAGKASETNVEKIPADIGEAQGLLWAFDSLYVVVNRGQKYASGLYRVRSSNHDDRLDEVQLLRKINGEGEHGPHAVLLHPDKKSLVIVCGNGTRMMETTGSRVPRLWGEDHLLPRMPDGRGFMKGVPGPGGCIYHVDPEGKNWELFSTGYRNEFDAAFNREGELFTYDADMEWDFNTPWYRPTRVCHVTSGSEFGWRNGSGKWPPYYPDSLPAIFEVGPGSPTGVCFGYGAKFPAKYQDAFFMCDWSYGKLYALHLTPEHSTYKATIEEFVSGVPLQLTDVVINPSDGALYFTIGGRKTTSGLYRVTYVGKEAVEPSTGDDRGKEARALRHRLEAFHGRRDPHAVDVAWPELGHADRFIRYAARVALEHQDPATWQERALAEKKPAAALTALLGLVRATSTCPFHRKSSSPPTNEALKTRILAALGLIGWQMLTDEQRLELLRTYEVLFNRMGKPDEAARQRVIGQLDPHFPASDWHVNAELCQVLVYLEAPGVAGKALKLMADASTQEEQMEYARWLRVLKTGWTPDERKAYFAWFPKASHYRGGMSFAGFLKNIRDDAVATLTSTEKAELKKLLDAPLVAEGPVAPVKPRPFVKKWTLDELLPIMEKGLHTRDFDRGKALFGAASCFACHRINNEGGAQGPDLTVVSGRFNTRDLLESIVEPSKVISDQYAAVVIETTQGKVVTGRIVNQDGDRLHILTNMLDPSSTAVVDRKQIESMRTSPISMMPTGLLDTLKQDEVLDLVAYLLSRGDRKHKMFAK
jgi:putative heme-binding domain-containing protein